ncbi:hypothetical protein PHPALM_27896 [Phytophthora palmivora]|uniref:Uncharacterized protein n=1 Tax=Phytophthora palmivora TaxID=4796 RepID=A0A2P4XBG0_9STRA|nr:hypothetical protein PHPALM_27896 [Phytophthora palmivora]
MESFQPGSSTASISVHTGGAPAKMTPVSREISGGQAGGYLPSVLEELRALKAEVLHLRGLVGAQAAIGGSVPICTSTTAPNAKSELPQAEFPRKFEKGEVRLQSPQTHMLAASRMFRSFGATTGKPLSAISFRKFEKGEVRLQSPQTHMLAASLMFRSFGATTGKPLSAISYALWMRKLDCIKFQSTPAALVVIFSGRLTLMHFKESTELEALKDGSSNATFRATSAHQLRSR